MIEAVMRRLPLPYYDTLRKTIIAYPRGSFWRNAAVAILKQAAVAYRKDLPGLVREIRPLDYPRMTFEPVDSMVMEAIYWFGVGGYEGIVPWVWVDLCRNSNKILEIGGNVGLFTVMGGRITRNPYTVVEPLPRNAATLRANLARNNCSGEVTVLEGAVVAGKKRQVYLNVPDEGRAMPVGAHLVEDVEVEGRSTKAQIAVNGFPIRDLVPGCDLIKIDAEGIEAVLLADVRDWLVEHKPTLMIEVLPEAVQLGDFLRDLALETGYMIQVLPEWGSDEILVISPEHFNSTMPGTYNSKDVVLSMEPCV